MPPGVIQNKKTKTKEGIRERDSDTSEVRKLFISNSTINSISMHLPDRPTVAVYYAAKIYSADMRKTVTVLSV